MELLGYIILTQVILFLLTDLSTTIFKESWQKRWVYVIRILLSIAIFWINFSGLPSNYIKEKIVTALVMIPVIISIIFQCIKNRDKYLDKTFELTGWAFWTQIVLFLVL